VASLLIKKFYFLGLIFTTIKMILRDTAQTLTEAVTKFNRLVKCPTINGGGRLIYRGTQKMTASQTRFTEADVLFTKAVTIARLVKSINRGGPKITAS